MVHARDGGVLDAAPGPVESLLVFPHAQHGLAVQEEADQGEAVMRVRLADCARALCPSRLFSFKESCAVEKMRGEDGEDGAASTNSTFLTLYYGAQCKSASV